MVDHVGFTVSDFEASKRFYVAALGALGYELELEPEPGLSGFLIAEGSRFWLVAGPATTTVHVAFQAVSRHAVDMFYAAAIQAGGSDNGPPGLRPHYEPHYYAAFVRDPDGNNVEAVCRKDPASLPDSENA